MKRFPNKRVVITGGGSGLGRALSLEFAKLGWRIGLVDINDAGARETLKSTDPWISEVAKTAFEKGYQADRIARKLVQAVAKNKLYAVPMFFGRMLWLNKRLTPNLYYNLTAWLNRRGWMKPLYLKLARWGVLSK